jgi:hypothetical protein
MFSMSREKRQEIKVRGWISGMGPQLCPCVVQDISAGGAKLSLERGHPPDDFRLYFSPYASNFRVCKVRWRKGDELGVEFVKKHPEGPEETDCIEPAGAAL